MTQDNGNWLSAEQAVMPDGTQRENLALVRKKLPAFGQVANAGEIADAGCDAQQGRKEQQPD